MVYYYNLQYALFQENQADVIQSETPLISFPFPLPEDMATIHNTCIIFHNNKYIRKINPSLRCISLENVSLLEICLSLSCKCAPPSDVSLSASQALERSPGHGERRLGLHPPFPVHKTFPGRAHARGRHCCMEIRLLSYSKFMALSHDSFQSSSDPCSMTPTAVSWERTPRPSPLMASRSKYISLDWAAASHRKVTHIYFCRQNKRKCR